MDGIKTLQGAILHFSNFENCKAVMARLRWPHGVVKCPRCGSDHVVYLAKNRVWKCYGKHESPKFSLKTGTIFEDSPLGLDKWLSALWLVVNCKNGISSCESARDLGVTQKTAWFMNHRLRFALRNGGLGMLCGEVEADETFIGGKSRNMHAPKRAAKITGAGRHRPHGYRQPDRSHPSRGPVGLPRVRRKARHAATRGKRCGAHSIGRHHRPDGATKPERHFPFRSGL